MWEAGNSTSEDPPPVGASRKTEFRNVSVSKEDSQTPEGRGTA